MAEPSRRQLAYLRALAERSGTTFAPPRTKAEASAEIARLKRRPRSAAFEAREDRREVSRRLATEKPASSVRQGEIEGYGSSARWRGREA